MTKLQGMPKSLQIVVKDDGGNVVGMAIASRKQFSTGSVGYYQTGKLQLANGERLQVSGNYVVIHSKDLPDSDKREW